MYYPNDIEDICYEAEHIDKVLSEIKINFRNYFDKFIDSEAGNALSNEYALKLARHFNGDGEVIKKKKKDTKNVFTEIIKESIESFNKDRNSYLEILDEESLEEYEDDPNQFKNDVLRNKCPIIRYTLHSKDKELDKYKMDFNISDPNELLEVVCNLTQFANDYNSRFTDIDDYESIESLGDLGLAELDTEEYVVYGVIGGGIKSHLLFKLYPEFFPNRSREAIWALWYLTSKKTFDCTQDSEFLMIDTKNSTTQQNYFYPYELFAFYANQIFKLLNNEAMKNDVFIKKEYRFVLVDKFLTFVAQTHSEEIDFMRSQLREGVHGY
jgi:hypothetical protein